MKRSLIEQNESPYQDISQKDGEESSNGSSEQNEDMQEKKTDTKNNSFIFQDENISNTNVSQQNERIASPSLDQNPDLLVEEIQPLNIKQEEPESSKDILEDAQIYTIEKTELSQIKDAQKEAEMTEENELDHIIELHEEHDQTDENEEKEKFLLPSRDPKHNYTLVVDLDETLIHYLEKPEAKTLQF